jgi:hypothetical protein
MQAPKVEDQVGVCCFPGIEPTHASNVWHWVAFVEYYLYVVSA